VPIEGLQDPKAFLTLLRRKVISLRMEKLIQLHEKLMDVLSANKPMEQLFHKEGIEINQSLLNYGLPMHPIVYHVNQEGESVIDLFSLMDEEILKGHMEKEIPTLPFEYYPSLDTSKYFGDKRLLASHHHAQLV